MLKKYENSYVAFIDVLGFKNLVLSRDDNDKEKLKEFYKTIDESFSIFNDLKEEIIKIAVSDLIILACPNGEESFRNLLKAIRQLQSDLAMKNIWVRGAVSVGDICFDDDWGGGKLIYGEGFIRAYELEKKAIYPRVIIDPRIIRSFDIDRDSFMRKYSVICLRNEENLSDAPSPVGISLRRLKDDLVAFSIREQHPHDNDIFVSYGSLIAYKQFSEPVNGMGQIYSFLKEEIYKEYEHYPKFSWVKNYFFEILSFLLNDVDLSLETKSSLNKEIEDFSNL